MPGFYALTDAGGAALYTFPAAFVPVYSSGAVDLTADRPPNSDLVFYLGDGKPRPGFHVLRGRMTATDEQRHLDDLSNLILAVNASVYLTRNTGAITYRLPIAQIPVRGFVRRAPVSSRSNVSDVTVSLAASRATWENLSSGEFVSYVV